MKKTFKRAGVAVLSMAMLLSMGAVSAVSANAALGDNVSITFPASSNGLKVYKVAAASLSDGVLKYTIQSDYTSLITKDGETLSATAAAVGTKTSLNNITSNSATAQKLAKKLADATTASAAYDIDATGGSTAIAPGYYLVVANSTAKSEPILLSVTDTTGTTAISSLKYNDITIDKTIVNIGGSTTNIKKDDDGHTTDAGLAQVGETIAFKISVPFPMYNPDSVKVVTTDNGLNDNPQILTEKATPADMTPFIITDVPEDTLNLLVGTNFSDVTVKVNNEVDPVGASTTINTDAVDETYKIEEVAADTANGKGKGFKITFDNAYMIKHRGQTVEVTFNGQLTTNPDVGADPNTNTAKVSYSNNYDTAKGTYNPGEEPTDTPKEESDDVDIFCTTVVVNKLDEAGQPLTGATFEIRENSATGTKVVDGVAGTGANENKFTFSGLRPGTYYLVETATPSSEYKLADPVKVVITDETAGDAYTPSSVTFNYSFKDATKSATNSVDINNYPGQTLPGTGGMGTVLFTVGGAAIVLLAGAMFVVYMRRRKNEE